MPAEQMGARRNRSTGTAIELLTGLVHTAWTSKRHVATLLSMDISGAFDTVVHKRLLAILEDGGLPGALVKWVSSFLAERSTTLVINGRESDKIEVRAGVP